MGKFQQIITYKYALVSPFHLREFIIFESNTLVIKTSDLDC
jgi:hypothetical protein